MATVIGSGIMGDDLSAGNEAVALLGNTIATGAILFVIIKSFEDNARNIGQISPYRAAAATINRLAREYGKINYMDSGFPFIENPFRQTQETSLPSAVLPSNLPSVIGGQLPTAIGTGATNTMQKGQTVFGPLDPVFGD